MAVKKGEITMLKAPRFMVEFMNYRIKQVKNDVGIIPADRPEIIASLRKTVKAYENGFATMSETMRILNEVPEYFLI